jgi:hypothetical protein
MMIKPITISAAKHKLQHCRLKFGDAEQIEMLRALRMFDELKRYAKEHGCACCDGKGYQMCGACHGTGYSLYGEPCSECEDGRIECLLCGGFGKLPSEQANIPVVKNAYRILQQRLRMAV